ncbi:hypothetical protein TCON_1492 [Astathelohania contejeani]|uniref:Uncharacterized protein n=1 Tax=Astathelohania contejeani TaxID=164912 RepID=A0ABQ7HYP6_9MICR|nr:hypothetical protein TCON_1492 [Thelohania contejeani]
MNWESKREEIKRRALKNRAFVLTRNEIVRKYENINEESKIEEKYKLEEDKIFKTHSKIKGDDKIGEDSKTKKKIEKYDDNNKEHNLLVLNRGVFNTLKYLKTRVLLFPETKKRNMNNSNLNKRNKIVKF